MNEKRFSRRNKLLLFVKRRRKRGKMGAKSAAEKESWGIGRGKSDMLQFLSAAVCFFVDINRFNVIK